MKDVAKEHPEFTEFERGPLVLIQRLWNQLCSLTGQRRRCMEFHGMNLWSTLVVQQKWHLPARDEIRKLSLVLVVRLEASADVSASETRFHERWDLLDGVRSDPVHG